MKKIVTKKLIADGQKVFKQDLSMSTRLLKTSEANLKKLLKNLDIPTVLIVSKTPLELLDLANALKTYSLNASNLRNIKKIMP